MDPANFGTTLVHEHLLFFNGAAPDDPGFQPIPDELKEKSVDYVVARLDEAWKAGIDTIVDVGPYRPMELYEKIAQRSKINIIVSTGFYRESTRPPWIVAMTEEQQMVDYMMKEITVGIENTRLKPGIIKVAQQKSPMSSWETKAFKAVAVVQKKTGIHVATHTGNAVEQFNWLTKNGADPHRLYFSHVDVRRHGKVGDLLPLLQAGSYLEVDTFGQSFYTSETELIDFIKSVCDAGFQKQLFISIDSNWHWVNGKVQYEGSEAPHFDKIAQSRTFTFMVNHAIPALLKAGFGLRDIHTFLVENPRRFFSNSRS
jgi:phosphotriesterase-related protein